MKRVSAWIAVPAAFAIASAIGAAAGVRVNWTPSMPVGLYRVQQLQGEPTRGMIVEACLPAPAAELAFLRGYVGTGACEDGTMPILKPVAAVPGDEVVVDGVAVRVNGRPVVPIGLPADSEGRPLPALDPGDYEVAPGEVWLLSDHESRGFDSRYFGAVRTVLVRREARPLLTF